MMFSAYKKTMKIILSQLTIMYFCFGMILFACEIGFLQENCLVHVLAL